jgi:hypothetical protein
MAYTGASLSMIQGLVGGGYNLWLYTNTDAIGTVTGASYFSDAVDKGLGLGDIIWYVKTDTPAFYACQITAIGATAATATDTATTLASQVSATTVDSVTYKGDGVTLSQLKWVTVTMTAALLDAAGNVAVIAGVAGDQYKIRHIKLVGGGTNYGAGGDRLIDLTDGTTVWTTIANADIEAAPAATLDWGNAKVPFLTGTSDTASASAAAIRFQYSGGTTDHGGVGSIKFDVCLEKVA